MMAERVVPHERAGFADLACRLRGARRTLLASLTICLALMSILALTIGPVSIPFERVLAAVIGWNKADQTEIIVLSIRLPRVVLALAAGAVLGLCGAALQGLFRNPLADPGLIGVATGGAFMVALSIVVMSAAAPSLLAELGPYALPVFASLGSFAAIAAVYALGRRNGALSSADMLLAGIAINAMAASGIGYLTFLSTDEQLRTLTFWMLGSLSQSAWEQILPAAALATACSLALMFNAHALNAYLLGEREARYLGVDVDRLKQRIIILSGLGVGAAVAVTGVIGFIGLVAPHIVRLMAGADHRIVLPGSALVGALILLIADSIARIAVPPAELPIGILTSAIGAPFFLWLLKTRRSAIQ